MLQRFFFFAPLGLLTLILSSCKTVDDHRQDYLSSYDGFEKKKGVSNALIFCGDLKRLAKYDKIYIQDIDVLAPIENSKGTKASGEESNHLAAMFEQSLKHEFAKSHKITNQRGENTLEIRAALDELNPNSPLLFAASYAPYVSTASAGIWAVTGRNLGAGSATLHAELIDSQTGERFYAIIDPDTTNKHQLKAGMSRWGQAEKSLQDWSSKFREVLDEAKTGTVSSSYGQMIVMNRRKSFRRITASESGNRR